MGIFLTPLVKSEINWFYFFKAYQRCTSFLSIIPLIQAGSRWRWYAFFIVSKMKPHPTPPLLIRSPLSASSPSLSLSALRSFMSIVVPLTHFVRRTSCFLPTCSFHLLYYCCFTLFIPQHNGISLTLTSPSSSELKLIRVNASQVSVFITL